MLYVFFQQIFLDYVSYAKYYAQCQKQNNKKRSLSSLEAQF